MGVICGFHNRLTVGFGYGHADSFLSLFGSICFLSLLTDSAIDDPEIVNKGCPLLSVHSDLRRLGGSGSGVREKFTV